MQRTISLAILVVLVVLLAILFYQVMIGFLRAVVLVGCWRFCFSRSIGEWFNGSEGTTAWRPD